MSEIKDCTTCNLNGKDCFAIIGCCGERYDKWQPKPEVKCETCLYDIKDNPYSCYETNGWECKYQPKPEPAKPEVLLGETVLTELEQDKCTPTKEQLDAYLAAPDDEIAAKLHREYPEKFVLIAKSILYGQNIAKAQDAHTRSEIAKVLKELAVPITVAENISDKMGHEVYVIKKEDFDRLIAELEGK